MTSREWFVVAVRVLGVWTLLGAVTALVTLHNVIRGFFRPESTTVGGYVLHAAVEMALGLYLLFGAESLAQLVYKRSAPDVSEDEGGEERPSSQ